MVASPWILRVEPASMEQVENWLKVEATGQYVLSSDRDSVEVDFSTIDDAFRFRMQFDEELIG